MKYKNKLKIIKGFLTEHIRFEGIWTNWGGWSELSFLLKLMSSTALNDLELLIYYCHPNLSQDIKNFKF